MHDKSSGRPLISDPDIAERAIILQILRNDHDERWSPAELQAESYDVAPTALADALDCLERHGVIGRCGEQYVASRCAFHMDALGMVSI